MYGDRAKLFRAIVLQEEARLVVGLSGGQGTFSWEEVEVEAWVVLCSHTCSTIQGRDLVTLSSSPGMHDYQL